jgi:nuclear pore complex protein Nup93
LEVLLELRILAKVLTICFTLDDMQLILKEKDSMDQHTTLKAFVQSIRTINESRLVDSQLDVLNLLKQAASSNLQHQDPDSDLIHRCWDLLSGMLQSENSLQGQYAKIVANKTDSVDPAAQQYKQQLVRQGRSWLETSYLAWLQNHVRGRRAEIGGVPTVHVEIDAMIHLRFKRNEAWTLSWLDTSTVPGTAFWAHVYFLVRCGLTSEALAYAKSHQAYLDGTTDCYFSSYLSAWLSSPDGYLPKAFRDRLLTEWNGHIRDILADPRMPPRGDVFKYTLYKLIGRCEMSTKTVRCDQVIASTDDYLWLQLMMVKEDTTKNEVSYERYTLQDFATKMVGYGPSYFKTVGVYFMVLVLCGEFERAIDLLLRDSTYAIEGLHYAIGLTYLGALRVPLDPKTSALSGGLLDVQAMRGTNYERAVFDFGRAILSFIKEWGRVDTHSSLQYAYLLGLLCNSAYPVNQQKAYATLAQAAVKDLVTVASSFTELLGDIRPDGTRQIGEIERFKGLIGIQTSQEFVESIILGAAKLAESQQQGVLTEAHFQKTVQLYHLAGQYDYVVSLLNQQLSDALASRQFGSGTSTPTQVPSQAFPSKTANIVELSEQLVGFYKARAHITTRISSKSLSSCFLLIALHRFMAQSVAHQDESALLTLERLDILPLEPDMTLVQRKVDQFRGIDETVARIVPDILVAAMKCIERLYLALANGRAAGNRESLRQDLQGKAKSLLMFAGCVQYRIPAEVFATLNRLDVMMS